MNMGYLSSALSSRHPSTRAIWIDAMRGLCMLAILLDHTEIYYTGDNIIPYKFYVVNVLVAFFFISGYLSYNREGFRLHHKLISIIRRLLIPYFFFTTVMALPKALVHGKPIPDGFLAILTGQASWFIVSLIVASFVFAILLWLSKGSVYVLIGMSLFSFWGCLLFSASSYNLYWQIEHACLAFPLLVVGYLYHRYEYLFKFLLSTGSLLVLSGIWVLVKLFEYTHSVQLQLAPIIVSHWSVFFLDVSVSTLLLTGLFQRLPHLRILPWVGEHSLVFYFMAGGIPLMVTKILQGFHLYYNGYYYRILLAFFLVCCLTAVVAIVIDCYFPWLIGKKRGMTSCPII